MVESVSRDRLADSCSDSARSCYGSRRLGFARALECALLAALLSNTTTADGTHEGWPARAAQRRLRRAVTGGRERAAQATFDLVCSQDRLNRHASNGLAQQPRGKNFLTGN